VKVLIVDDEAPARERLQALLADDPEHAVVGVAHNGAEAIEAAAELRPDVVLLDIRMPGLNGIEAAHHLNEFAEPPAIVFTTAYDEYAIEAFDANAVGYLLKPVRRERLDKAMRQAARITNQAIDRIADASGVGKRRSHLCARVQDELKLIPVSSISLFAADQKYTRVHHDDGDHLIDDSLKTLEEEFPARFVRIHRSALVAVSRIDSLQKAGDGQTCVILRDEHSSDDKLIISRRHLADVKRRIRGD
jgi:two-component system response regulator AlgR